VAQFFLARGGLNGAVELSPTVTIPAGPPAEPAVTARGPGVLVVDGVGGGENAFATLEQACAAADSGDVIELRYNGPRGERPITLNNRKLTIRAAEQFQPSLVFRPLVTDPLKYPRAMFALNGSQVTLLGVSVELDIPRESQAESWSLFELRQAKSTRLDKCVLSIRNASEQQRAYHQEVAFFRITSPPESGVVGSGAPAVPEGTGVSLLDCVVRGEATLLRVHDLRPFQLTWDNGLLVTTERLLVADGGQRAVQPAETVKIELRHLTAVVRSGLCRFDQNESAPRQLPAQIACTNSILLAGAGAALIEQTGIAPADRHRERIDWNGERNFYEGFTTYWTAQSIAPEQPPEPWSFETWLSYWGPQRENLAKSNRVRWNQLPTGDRPVHAHVPADYALSASTGPANPALGAASDARDAGCRFDRLPPMPAPSAAAPAKSETPESPGAKPKP
jgi:serine/threonine-protein kinase